MAIFSQSQRKENPLPSFWALLGVVVILNLFQMFFAPGALRYRILFLPAFLALILWGVPWKIGRLGAMVGGLVIFGMGVWNFTSAVGPAHRPSMEFQRTQWLAQHVGPSEFLIFGGQGPDSVRNVYLAYFAPQIPARSFYGYLFSHPGGDMRELITRMEDTHARGGRVLIEKELMAAEEQSMMASWAGASSTGLQDWLKGWRKQQALAGPGGYDLVILAR